MSASSYFNDFYQSLLHAVADGGANALSYLEAEARKADGLEFTFPAYAAITAWGNTGFELITKIALAGHTVKSKSAALTLFAMIASQGNISADESYVGILIPKDLAQAANEKLSFTSARSDAKHAIRNLILALPTEDLLVPVSQSFMHLSMFSPEIAEELVLSLTVKWLRFGHPTLDDYSALMRDNQDHEPSFQEFFCRFPQMLDPMALQVWSQPDFHGAYEPDFVVRRTDNSYVVVEIECPGKLLVTKGGQMSRDATHAEQQAVEYEAFLSERVAEARQHFPHYNRAECLVVIGNEAGLDDRQRTVLERVNSRRQNVRIVGFDWLLNRARSVIENVGEGNVEVILRHRII